ncbi:hypothetical protein HZQ19_04030 [Elizabethkingia anophelis]|uniref:hypothetical protein n=1 Tax=Elizabethkingia anophelis TaxID=1117645 RepID=UPI000C9BA3AD|nr:hypothetical protein [Elizabethkingia anophelis]MCT3758848.1 hypothetical protein [Elizabethkingia anophelis]MCT3972559.1 hypothetical protein [Elizabethkingia anophelis]MCT4001033.1 hypothetical protein [Elizabethkingia anophelis]MCT4014904.1 hypothetical protein [Elizabethkingia anophelis]MCT4018613.1 hypothetical protein [Elizabethkingia anophelis]
MIFSIIDFLTNEKVLPALISAFTTIIVLFLTLTTKNFIETRILRSKLNTEHRFEQRKKIKEALAKHKVHLLTACEDVNHRLWNLSNNHHRNWIKINGDYHKEHYYFHSTAYKLLCLYFWIGRIKKEMIFLDTTIASKEDLEFIKFLKLFPNVLCDLTFIAGDSADGEYAIDHFFRTEFEQFPNLISNAINEPITYSDYKAKIPHMKQDLVTLYQYIDGVNPDEQRMRWDRLHLLHLTVIIFLNNYGYDFQKTNEKKIEQIITKNRICKYLKNYINFLEKYKLDKNREVKKLEKIAKKYYSNSI